MFVGSSAFTIYEVGGNYKYSINRRLCDLMKEYAGEFTLLEKDITALEVMLFFGGRKPTLDAKWIPVMILDGAIEDQSYCHYHVTCVDGENKTHTCMSKTDTRSSRIL